MTQEIVRALVDGVWVTEVANQGGSGGSQTVRMVDAGNITAEDCARLGPQTLYAPAEGEYVIPTGSVLLAAEVLPGSPGGELLTGTLADVTGLNPPYPAVDSSSTHALLYAPGAPSPQSAFTDGPPFEASTDPIIAAYTPDNTNIVDVAPGTWQATHAYAQGAWLIDSNDHIQRCSTAGTSGSSEPTWDDQGGPTTDGNAEWTDWGLVPSEGSIHVALQVVTPAEA